MLRRQHKVEENHHDMPLIYYMEGHTLYFGRPEFSLITGFRLELYVLVHILVDEETFGKLYDEHALRLCLLLALEVIFMGRLLTFNVDDTLLRLVDNLEAWNSFPWGEHLWTHLYDEIKNLKERQSDEHYYGLKKDRNYVPTYTLSGFIWILETFERSKNKEYSSVRVPPDSLGLPVIGKTLGFLNALKSDKLDVLKQYVAKIDEEIKHHLQIHWHGKKARPTDNTTTTDNTKTSSTKQQHLCNSNQYGNDGNIPVHVTKLLSVTILESKIILMSEK
ncbi:hypothetical protein Tco_1023488 [Tanacetum coccineum]